MARKLSPAKQRQALAIVAEWMGKWTGNDGPVPTGLEASRSARGPVLMPGFDFPREPVPAIVLEGMNDWAIYAAADEGVRGKMAAAGIFAEPWSSWALCLYPVVHHHPA